MIGLWDRVRAVGQVVRRLLDVHDLLFLLGVGLLLFGVYRWLTIAGAAMVAGGLLIFLSLTGLSRRG